MLYVPPEDSPPSVPLPSSSSLPPQAVISIAAAMAVATSELLRLLNFTCNASLNPRDGGGNGQVGPRRLRRCRTTDWSRAKRTLETETSLIRRVDPRHGPGRVSTTVIEL